MSDRADSIAWSITCSMGEPALSAASSDRPDSFSSQFRWALVSLVMPSMVPLAVMGLEIYSPLLSATSRLSAPVTAMFWPFSCLAQ